MTHPTTPWTESEDDLLREHYATMDRQQLAQLVGHSVNATAVRAYKLGLKRDPALVRAARMKAGADEGRREWCGGGEGARQRLAVSRRAEGAAGGA